MSDYPPNLIALLHAVQAKTGWTTIERCGHWMRYAKSQAFVALDDQENLCLTELGMGALCGRKAPVE